MLGFSSYSEVPYSVASVSDQALAYPAAVTAALASGTLAYDAQAFTTLNVATSSFATGTLDLDAKANQTIAAVTSTTAINGFTSVTGKATGNLSTTAAFLNIYITDSDEDAQATAFIGTVSASTAFSGVDYDAKANITTGTANATGNVNEPDYIWGTAKVYPQSLLGTLTFNLDVPTTDNFPYEDYADDYNRARVLYILEYQDAGTSTVFIPEENTTVFVDAYRDSSTTVFIES